MAGIRLPDLLKSVWFSFFSQITEFISWLVVRLTDLLMSVWFSFSNNELNLYRGWLLDSQTCSSPFGVLFQIMDRICHGLI